MKISAEGLEFIREFEKLKLEAYRDSGGVWTVGYGHTGADVTPGLKIDEPVAEALLRGDVGDAERCINSVVKVALSQPEYDALCSFIFNIGVKAFRESTMLRLLNEENYTAAALQFKRWVYDDRRVVAGLVNRREAERKLFEA